MKKLVKAVRGFLRDESGLETVEWGIIAGIIVAGTIAAIVAIGNWTGTKLNDLSGKLT